MLKIASSTISRKFMSWISTGSSFCLMRHRSRMFWSVRRNAVPSSSADRRRLLGAVRERVVLAGQHRDDRFDDAVERRAQLAGHLLDEVVLELLDLAELLVAAQQLDVLGEEGLGELEDLFALLVLLRPSLGWRIGVVAASSTVRSPRRVSGVVETQREMVGPSDRAALCWGASSGAGDPTDQGAVRALSEDQRMDFEAAAAARSPSEGRALRASRAWPAMASRT